MVKGKVMVFSSCSAGKDCKIQLSNADATIKPEDYLGDDLLRTHFLNIRSDIFSDPTSKPGKEKTYAFNLYVRKGLAYKQLLAQYYEPTLEALKRREFEWFFLSGGFGLIHALEEGHSYQATFSRGIAYQNNIPYTGTLWKHVLPHVIDSVIGKYKPDRILVFGSRDYTSFLKSTKSYTNETGIFEITESYGSSGPSKLSPIIARTIQSII
jgi:hypothetical protein